LLRDFLRAQMLFDCHGVVGAAFDSGIVADDHAIDSFDAANAGDDARARGTVGAVAVGVHTQRSQRGKFQKGRPGVQ